MAKKLRDQRKTDAGRTPRDGTGKLDADTSPRRIQARKGAPPADPLSVVADRLRANRDDAVAKLRDLGLTPRMDDDAPREVGLPVLDEGDAAQATERMDMSLAARQRLAERVNRLTAALERIAQGTYGTCDRCGGEIERARLTAMPEALTCLACQENAERARGPAVA
jgi:DnaK suppressor protein